MKKSETKKKSISAAILFHYLKFLFRSVLFVAGLGIYIVGRINGKDVNIAENKVLWAIVWCLFGAGIYFRLFPTRIESTGCQKHLAQNYVPSTNPEEGAGGVKFVRVLPVVAIWAVTNIIIATLRFTNIIDDGIVYLISLFYGMMDVFCILFYCPFRSWFMKNKCCTACRIYNWDYILISTPLVFTESIIGKIVFGLSFFLWLQWEILAFTHPERFSPGTNAALKCANCEEKLCQHRKRVRRAIFGKRKPGPSLSLTEKEREFEKV